MQLFFEGMLVSNTHVSPTSGTNFDDIMKVSDGNTQAFLGIIREIFIKS